MRNPHKKLAELKCLAWNRKQNHQTQENHVPYSWIEFTGWWHLIKLLTLMLDPGTVLAVPLKLYPNNWFRRTLDNSGNYTFHYRLVPWKFATDCSNDYCRDCTLLHFDLIVACRKVHNRIPFLLRDCVEELFFFLGWQGGRIWQAMYLPVAFHFTVL